MDRARRHLVKENGYWVYGTYGNTANQTSAGTFNRFTQGFILIKPFRLEAVIWNIATTQTYSLELVSSTANSPTIYRTLASGLSLTGGSVDNTITVPCTLLNSGYHYLSLYCTTAVVQRRNSAQPVFDSAGLLVYNTVGYNGSATTTGTAPFRFVGSYYEM